MRNRRLPSTLIAFLSALLPAVVGQALAQSASSCAQYQSWNVGNYTVMTNYWNQGGCPGSQCVTVNTSTGAFGVTQFTGTCAPNVASYPAIYYGCHYGACSPGTNLPTLVSGLTCVTSSWDFTPTLTGQYDIAYDIWFSTTTNTSGGYGGGAELMIWLNTTGNPGPAGTLKASNVSIDGYSFNIYEGNIGWNYIAYVISANVTSVSNLNILNFINDSVSRGYINTSWYLAAIEAGNEFRTGGAPFTTNSFSASVNNGCAAVATPTFTSTPTNTAASTPSGTPSFTRTSTPSATPSFTPTASPTGTPSATPSSSMTPTASRTASKTATATPSGTPTSSATGTASATATPTGVNTATPTPSSTSTASASATPSATASRTPTLSPTRTATVTQSASPTSTASLTATSTGAFTATNTPTATPTASATNTDTSTPSLTPTASPSFTATPSATSTGVSTATGTPTSTASPSMTATPSFTPTRSPTATASATPSATPTGSPTFTPINTASFTPTFTAAPPGRPIVVLFPNPVFGPGPVTLRVTLPSPADEVAITVYTTAFRKVNSLTAANLPAGTTAIPLPLADKAGVPLANGLYYLVVKIPQGRIFLKLLIIR